ncbi:hypothetical protein F4859DRAFT_511483 [Xylaria cf. heliscus]|nr:hypothetical protein F4859DRAFT_511483 [Xylaria cf. heliscus]
MCFAEYIAYTCGHTSVAVNRPCPMTTHLHNNPCCPRPACRPFLAHTMCPSCNRILHSRRVDIVEYEHRWMHERGACGCDVQFPALLHPRIVRRSTAVADEDDTEGGDEFDAPDAGFASARSGFVATGSHHGAGGQAAQSDFRGRGEERAAIPLYQEAQVGESVEVAVRLSSLYAAEWTRDHAKLHETGQCRCPVSFERYKPADVGDSLDEDDGTEVARAWNPSYDRAFFKEASHPSHLEPPPPDPSYSMNPGPSSDGANPANNMRNNPYEHDRIPPGHVARWAMEGPPGSLLDEILGPVARHHGAPVPVSAPTRGGHPADRQTVHYETSGVPISGYPIACPPFATSEGAGLPSIVDFGQPDVTIAGFPIGAGPEGEPHSRDFETCGRSLRSSSNSGGDRDDDEDDNDDSPVRMRRLSSEF